MVAATKCYLHIPHKYWAKSPDEQGNYLTIERWVRDVFRRFRVSPLPLLHIPHKQWSSLQELENYLAIERWANRVLAIPYVTTITFSTENLTRYDLVIPYKSWAIVDDQKYGRLELENYLEIERWARRVVRQCFPHGCGCG